MSRSAGLLEAAAPPSRPDGAEEARLRAVARYVVLDTAAEPEFDDLTELASLVTGCAFAAITFTDADRVWVKSAHGFDAREIARDLSFSRSALGLGPQLIANARGDARCHGVPWVHADPFAVFYAAEPLVTSDGFTLGHLLVMDRAERRLTARTLTGLTALARQVMALLELRRTLVCYHTVIDGAGLVVFHTDAAGRLVSLTPTWAKLTGHGVVRSLGKPLHALVHADDGRSVETQLSQILNGQHPARFDCRVTTATGTDLPAELFAQPLPTDHGLPGGVVGVIADISERRAREIEDQHRQKLESLGRLAAGVAHEINTPVQFIGDNTRYLAEAYDQMLRALESYDRIAHATSDADSKVAAIQTVAEDLDLSDIAAEVPSAAQQTLDGVERVATIVRAMKAMSHPGHDHQAPADVNEAIKAAVAVAHNELKYDAEIALELNPLPPVVCFVADLSQVFLNMLINAADAIRESDRRGRITISTDHDNTQISIRIADTGVGIPAHARAKIFDPFFTTKPVGRGTGQGLALAHVVVYEKHGGSIEVESAVGVGTTFTLRIPISGVSGGAA